MVAGAARDTYLEISFSRLLEAMTFSFFVLRHGVGKWNDKKSRHEIKTSYMDQLVGVPRERRKTRMIDK